MERKIAKNIYIATDASWQDKINEPLPVPQPQLILFA